MPIIEIQVKEYECAWCHYKWINRVNGKDGPTPDRCAKCKRGKWINGELDIITPEENGLRRRIKAFDESYPSHGYHINWPSGLTEKFLSIDNPRPTISELYKIMRPLGCDIHEYPGYLPDPDRGRGYFKRDFSHYIPDPDKPGRMKYNDDYSGPTEYEKLLREEAQKRIQIMLEIMKSRGIDYDPTPILEKQQKEYEEQQRQAAKEREEMLKLPLEERERLFNEDMEKILSGIRPK